jgi:hypothetical protein
LGHNIQGCILKVFENWTKFLPAAHFFHGELPQLERQKYSRDGPFTSNAQTDQRK